VLCPKPGNQGPHQFRASGSAPSGCDDGRRSRPYPAPSLRDIGARRSRLAARNAGGSRFPELGRRGSPSRGSGGARAGILRAPPDVMIGSSSLRQLFGRRRGLGRRPRLVRRVGIHCPRDGRPVEVDLLIGRTGPFELVLRCSAHPGGSPPCDQACRRSAEAALAPARALIVCPSRTGPVEEID